MTTTTQMQSGADYADALITARSAKMWLFVLLTASLVIQITFFFLLRNPNWFHHPPMAKPDYTAETKERMQYIVGAIDFIGLIGSILFSLVILLLLHLQLAARVIGVRRLTSSFILSLLIALLMFPWQAVLNNPLRTYVNQSVDYATKQNDLGMKIPGVLYTWAEVSNPKFGATFTDSDDWTMRTLHWARFVGFPIGTLILLGIAQIRSSRGIRQSLSGTPSPTTSGVI